MLLLRCFQIIIPKLKNEPLGVVIVESGWGSMVPTIVLASMAPGGAAARCSQLNVGDQIMSVNGISLVGLPLSTCQNYIKVLSHSRWLFVTLLRVILRAVCLICWLIGVQIYSLDGVISVECMLKMYACDKSLPEKLLNRSPTATHCQCLNLD